MKIPDKHGREWVMVPKESTLEIRNELSYGGSYLDMWRRALAAAPEFEAPEVTDMTCECIWANFGDYVFASPAKQGMGMIAAVQQVLGPMLGLVPILELKRAYTEAYRAGFDDGANPDALNDVHASWVNSQARKRIEGEGRG